MSLCLWFCLSSLSISLSDFYFSVKWVWMTIKQQVLPDIASALGIWLEISNLDSLPDGQRLILSEYMLLLLYNAFDLLSMKVSLFAIFLLLLLLFFSQMGHIQVHYFTAWFSLSGLHGLLQ